jgi:hypothetical protein
MARINFEISGAGTLYVSHPLPIETHDWVAEHMPADALRLGDAVTIKWRYSEELTSGPSRTARDPVITDGHVSHMLAAERTSLDDSHVWMPRSEWDARGRWLSSKDRGASEMVQRHRP